MDDDPTLLKFLGDYLAREGYQPIRENRGQAALKTFFREHPDLVVLDVMMPGMDGWEVCARMRELADTPIIMLTAKTAETDKLRGFRLGVDDYVTKPFSMAEITARIGAVLARSGEIKAADQKVIQAGPLRIDLKRREVKLEGEQISLTPTEFRLLAVLAKHLDEAVSKEQLIDEIWGEYRKEGGSALRRYISFLRGKIESNPERPSRLLTVRGYGYRLKA